MTEVKYKEARSAMLQSAADLFGPTRPWEPGEPLVQYPPDLVERLENTHLAPLAHDVNLCTEAAAEIRRLRIRVQELEEGGL